MLVNEGDKEKKFLVDLTFHRHCKYSVMNKIMKYSHGIVWVWLCMCVRVKSECIVWNRGAIFYWMKFPWWKRTSNVTIDTSLSKLCIPVRGAHHYFIRLKRVKNGSVVCFLWVGFKEFEFFHLMEFDTNEGDIDFFLSRKVTETVCYGVRETFDTNEWKTKRNANC